MLTNFTDCLESCLSNRVDEINDEVIAENNEYRELSNEIGRLYTEILASLPKEAKNLIGQYEEVTGVRECVSQSLIYKQGLMDGRVLKAQVKSVLFYRHSTASKPPKHPKTYK